MQGVEEDMLWCTREPQICKRHKMLQEAQGTYRVHASWYKGMQEASGNHKFEVHLRSISG